MTRLELEQWLCGDRTRLPTTAEIAALLGLASYTARSAPPRDREEEARRARARYA